MFLLEFNYFFNCILCLYMGLNFVSDKDRICFYVISFVILVFDIDMVFNRCLVKVWGGIIDERLIWIFLVIR